MSWEIVGIGAILLVFVCVAIFWKNPYVKKYRKYTLILLPALVVIVIALILKIKGKKIDQQTGGGSLGKPDLLQTTITNVSKKIEKVNLQSSIEVQAARTKNQAVVDELKKIEKISDEEEQMAQLIALNKRMGA